VTDISPVGVDTSLDEVDPLFAQATVVQASEYRRHHRHHHRSRRKQRRNRLILLWVIAAAVLAVGVGALALRQDDSTITTVTPVGFGSSTTAASAAPVATTAATAATPASTATWTYKDLKGQTVTVKATDKGTTRFEDTPTGPMPSVIINIDKAFAAKGCVGGEAAYQQWNPVTPSALATPRYSAYTRYAVDKAKAMNCPWASSIPTA
jgi:hypothetical protein